MLQQVLREQMLRQMIRGMFRQLQRQTAWARKDTTKTTDYAKMVRNDNKQHAAIKFASDNAANELPGARTRRSASQHHHRAC